MTIETSNGFYEYYFRKNIFGDIVGVYDPTKGLLATYTYDAFGNSVAKYTDVLNNKAYLNPFRYRGYYWDDDLELYYLQSRYYDPEIGRFISPDSIEYITPSEIFGLNLYAYCNNNPIMNVDPTGKDWNSFWGWMVSAIIAVAAIAAIVVVAAGVVATGGLLGSVLLGAGIGALTSMGSSIVAQGGFNSANPWMVAKSGAIGAAIGAASSVGSFAIGEIGGIIGQQFGFALGNTTHISSGIRFGQVFSTNLLMETGKLIGGIVGGVLGGTGMNLYFNEISGKTTKIDELIEEGIYGEIPSWLIRLFRWLFI